MKKAGRYYHQEVTITPGKNELKYKTPRYENNIFWRKIIIFSLKVENRITSMFYLLTFLNKTLKTCLCICIIDCQGSNLAKKVLRMVSKFSEFSSETIYFNFFRRGQEIILGLTAGRI